MSMLRTLATSAAALALGAGIASAATFTVVGTDTTVISAAVGNNLVEPVFGENTVLNGVIGQLGVSANTRVRFEFLGFEAGAENVFGFGGADLWSTPCSGTAVTPSPGVLCDPVLATPWISVAGGPLDFYFKTDLAGASPAQVNNAPSNNSAANITNFAITLDGLRTAYLWFDDSGGTRPSGERDDDNHDDMLIRVSIIPLPAPAFLLLGGMGVFGGMAALRRRKQKAAA
ncbi:VPLPA-CTERM sorting domain-containing protein [Pararhodobacter sp. SW119]|uniref:VPLPA-CTERM sorting domain-containing protein n=1 Tax=Pararhodobacter sp. SW119 TaxID=2780075 RepID=UPI001ADF7477|nr:VPLPA-CTERM sorting domain-containing protein [Pararhodobacter sp. SW119]